MNETNENKWSTLEEKMLNLRCADYGFECGFQVQGETEHVITKFSKHTIDIHGIEYGNDVIGQVMRRKYPKLKIQ